MIFLEKKTFLKYSKYIICMFILTLSSFLYIRGAFKNIESSFYLTPRAQTVKKQLRVDKRNVDHIYINGWFPVYRWGQ